MKDFYNLKKDFIFLKNNSKKNNRSKNIWENRSTIYFNLMSNTNGELDYNFFNNFRSHKKKFISENPSRNIDNFFFKRIYNHQYSYIKFIYDKLKLKNKKLKFYLKFFRLDNIGNPGYCTINNLKLNERFLRHCHFFSLFDKFFSQKKIDYVTDIGGGYGSFARLLHKKHKKIKIILIDLPEQLLTAKYYLESNFPNSKISNIKDIYNLKKIDDFFLLKYNIILVPHTHYNKLKINFKKNLIINFNSFGEIDRKSFDNYMKSLLLRKSKYFFSVNRLDSFPTYNNSISYLDFNFDKYKKIYSKISPVWDYFFIKKLYLFKTKKIFSSRILEFIGENKNI